MANGDGISRESFSKLPQDSKLDILFDFNVSHSQRLEKLEKRKIYDKLVASGVGIVAAVGAVFGKFFITGGK